MATSGSEHIPDEVWSRLDLNSGQLSSRTKTRVILAAIGLIVAAIVGHVAVNSGVISPRLTEGPGWDGSLRISSLDRLPPAQTREIHTAIHLLNDGWYAVEVLGVGEDIPGLRFDGLSQYTVGEVGENRFKVGNFPMPLPFAIEPGYEGVRLNVHYEVTDCQLVPAAPQPIAVKVARPWGVQTVFVQPEPLRANHGGWSLTTREDPHHIEWQRFLADDVCGTRTLHSG